MGYYYLNAEEARSYYQKQSANLRESCQMLANNGVDKLLQCDVLNDETTVNIPGNISPETFIRAPTSGFIRTLFLLF